MREMGGESIGERERYNQGRKVRGDYIFFSCAARNSLLFSCEWENASVRLHGR